MYDVIYTKPENSKEIIKPIIDRWPNAIVHTTMVLDKARLEVTIQNVGEDEFYPAAMVDGYAMACVGFRILIGVKDLGPRVDHWIELAEKMKEKKNEADI